MNLTSILADSYRRLGYPTSPASAITTRLTAFANEVQQEIMSEPGMEFLLNDLVTFASIASQQQYGLTPQVVRVKQMWEITNDREIYPMSLGTYRGLYPDPSAVTGIPQWYVVLGEDAVSTEISTAATPYVISTSASDGAAVTAYLEGFRTGGIPFTDSKAMNGVTAVATTYTDVINVTKFYLSAAAVGTVTLREASGVGTVLATIQAPLMSWSRQLRIALAPTPSGAVTYQVECEREVLDLVNGTDQPMIPTKFHRLIGLGIRRKEYETKDNTRYLQVTQEYRKALSELKFFVFSQAVGSPNLRWGATAVDLARQRLTAW